MRASHFAILGLIVLVALAVARGSESIAFPFESKARAPEGAALKLTFSPRAGEIYEERVVQSGTATVPEVDGSREVRVEGARTVAHRCVEARPDGARVMTSRIERLEGDGADDPDEIAEMLKVVVTWRTDRQGAIQERSVNGGTEAARAKVEGLLFDLGERPFLAFPAAGVRVGEAFDYLKTFEASDMRRSSLKIPGAPEPEAKSEVVFERRATLGSEPVAEFHVNAVVFQAADVPGREGRMESASRYTGSLVVSAKTGVPTGRMEMRLEGRVSVLREGARVTVSRDVKVTRAFAKRASTAEAENRPR